LNSFSPASVIVVQGMNRSRNRKINWDLYVPIPSTPRSERSCSSVTAVIFSSAGRAVPHVSERLEFD
jgi:hypothetical protein